MTGNLGAPLAGIDVTVTGDWGEPDRHATTGPTGTYSIVASVGDHQVEFSDPNGVYPTGFYAPGGLVGTKFMENLVHVVDSDVSSIDVSMPLGAHIMGRVVDASSTGIPGISVSAGETTVVSSGTGDYSIVVFANSTYTIAFHDPNAIYGSGYFQTSAPGFVYSRSMASYVATVTGPRVIGTSILPAAIHIAGTVRHGVTDLAGIAVSACVDTFPNLPCSNATTGTSGSYSLEIAPGQSYQMEFSDASTTYATTRPSARVAVGERDITGIDVDLPLAVTLMTHAVVVDGMPALPFASTVADLDDGGDVMWKVAYSAWAELEPGTFSVYAGRVIGWDTGDAWELENMTCTRNDAVALVATIFPATLVASEGDEWDCTFTYKYQAVGGSVYHPLTPKRLLDTRDGTGGISGPFRSHVSQTFAVAGGSSPVPSGATAVTGNLTVTQQTSGGFLYIGPNPADNPGSSTLNFPAGDDRANAVTVALSAGGTLSVTFAAPALGPTAHVIFDVTGWFGLNSRGSTYHPLTPVRLLDTRKGTGGISNALESHMAQSFVLRTDVVPADATAVTGNLTVTQQTKQGYLYLGPSLMNDPTSSTLNFPVGDDRANAVTVALGPDHSLSVTYAAPIAGATAHVILDVTGYFAPDDTGAYYWPITPSRFLDTRDGTGGLLGALGSHAAQSFVVAGRGTLPSGATAVTGNLTVTQQTALGFLYVGPEPANDPTSSTLNFPAGDDRANAVTVALSSAGTLSVTYAAPTRGPTAQAILDVTGYFGR